MVAAMKFKFRMYRRGRIYYVEDNETGQQESLERLGQNHRRPAPERQE